ncbi:hypothetical protein [Pedobacter frigoris]|uniref:toxin-antitoxin system YwqK family antitoxin n=1 Tax=Pedobacter frigoris TaxID=2571272 RepID=UPI0029303EEE|nr:hypothetical protein [Pedobacter frigoris]
MKKLSFLLIINILSISSHAQTFKSFLDKLGNRTDSVHAVFYILQKIQPDSLWNVQQFDLNDSLVMIGTYKDAAAQVRHGRFAYFSIQKYINPEKPPVNTIRELVYFDNNLKTGRWSEFGYDGRLAVVSHYSNDKRNGKIEYYFLDTPAVSIKGQYINGSKEGKWYSYNKRGDTITIESYKNDEVIGRYFSSYYTCSEPPKQFSALVEKSVINLLIDGVWKTTVICKINTEGKVTSAAISSSSTELGYKKLSRDEEEKLEAIMLRSPDWKPAYDRKLKKNIEDTVFVRLTSIKGELTFSYYNSPALNNL